MLNSISRRHDNERKRRVGRGGKRGKTSGRGHKGQKSRAGGSPRPEIRDVIKKLPKLRGYNFNSVKGKPAVVNVGDISSAYKADEIVSPDTLLEKGLVRRQNGRLPKVKILGDGEVDKALSVTNCQVSSSAQEKITATKGTITE